MYNGFSAHSNTCSQHYAPIRKQEVNAQQADTQKFRQKWLETNSNGATAVSSQSVNNNNNNPQQSNFLPTTITSMPTVSNYTAKSTTLNHTSQSAQYYYDAIKKQPPSNDYSINAAGQSHNHHQYYDVSIVSILTF